MKFRTITLATLFVGAVLALGIFTAAPAAAQCDVTADVVAMDQVIVYNRLGAFSPAGMIFALAQDVFPKGTPATNACIDIGAGSLACEVGGGACTTDADCPAQTLANSCASPGCAAGNVQLRDNKRPRPLTLRANEGDTICINFQNLLNNPDIFDAQNEAPGIQLCEPTDGAPRPAICQSQQPVTRHAGIHVNGLYWATGEGDDGSNVGANLSSLVAPGGSTTYKLHADKEGAYVITSGPNLGGEGGSGAIASGLFGVLNVEPAGAEWYRNQTTREEMWLATPPEIFTDTNGNGAWDPVEICDELTSTCSITGGACSVAGDCPGEALTDTNGNGIWDAHQKTAAGHPILDYDAVYPAGHPYAGQPILKIRDALGNIVHNELNAVITGPGRGGFTEPPSPVYPNRGQPFREFTIAFHDEVKMVQAFPGWFDALPFTLGSVKDGFAINYGTGGIGAEIIGNRLGVGPMHECAECKYEEFFLTAWAVGDPAMIVDIPANAGLETLAPGVAPPAGTTGPKATRAFYPDDPSNVFHGYLNDRTKVRNIHVGTEHHIFHLHAHQWLFAQADPKSNYLDAQALGPGSSFTYEIAFGGGGNRAKSAGDAIFHCHFYPHFAQGMWGLWRVHDTFEIGSFLDADGRVLERGLPDSEICSGLGICGGYDASGNPIGGGSPTPAVVPLPDQSLPPMPGFMVDTDGGGGPETPFNGYPFYIPGVAGHRPPTPPLDLVDDGGIPRHVITAGTYTSHETPTDFDKTLTTAEGFQLPETGTPAEKAAMVFHGCGDLGAYGGDVDPALCSGGPFIESYKPDGSLASGNLGFQVNGLPPVPGAPYAEPCRADTWVNDVSVPWSFGSVGNPRTYAASVIELDVELNKVGWHFGQQRLLVLDQDIAATMAGTRAPEPFVMRANTNDCVDFDHTNRVPNVYQLDDFQVKTPTDVIGQHIHLVKFDVTSADGAANGWNYEDGTLSPDETAERIGALNLGSWDGDTFGAAAPRTTRQRWYVDRGWEGNVFTHDHYGPSTHQQAGLYATLLVEPEGATFSDPVTGVALNPRQGGHPTSWRADIDCAGCSGERAGDAWREFYLEFADFQLAYRSAAGDGVGILNGAETPVNPSDRNVVPLPDVLLPCQIGGVATPNGCRPEAISAADPGTFVVNYRNEPLAMRLRDPGTNAQAANPVDLDGDAIPDTTDGDLAYAFTSGQPDGLGGYIPFLRADLRLNDPPELWPYGASNPTATQGAMTGDPFTPTLRVYEDDKVVLRVQVGATEEGHNFSMNGVRWLQQWQSPYSGFRNSQMAGISEYFLFRTPGLGAVKAGLEFEDYLYQTGSSVDARWNGSWGIMRAYQGLRDDLLPLPNNPDGKAPPISTNVGGLCEVSGNSCQKNNECDPGEKCIIDNAPNPFNGICPIDAPERKYDVLAVRAADVLPLGTLEYKAGSLHDPTAMLYVLASDLDPATGLLKPERRVEPLILRAAAGDCVFITLTNMLGGPPLDLDGYNTLPMIINQFNGNQIAPSSEVGLHAQLVEYDMFDSDGMNVGFNLRQTAAPGETVNYKWYAGKIDTTEGTLANRTWTPVEYGAINLSAADPIEGSSKGLIGALIVEPENSTWAFDGEPGTDGLLTRAAVSITEPPTGVGECSLDPLVSCLSDAECTSEETYCTVSMAPCTQNRDCRGGGGQCEPLNYGVCLQPPGDVLFRDFVVLFQDDVNMRFGAGGIDGGPVPTVSEEEEPEDTGMKAINYRTDPVWERLALAPTGNAAITRAFDFTNAFAGEPVTPIFTASPGQEIRFRVLKPGGHNRNQVFTLHGHFWARHPFGGLVDNDLDGVLDTPTTIDPANPFTFWHGEQMGHGPSNHINAIPYFGAGVAGDYLYRDMVPVHVYNGAWGILRVQ